MLVFDYGSEPFAFATSLSASEAEAVRTEINNRLP
jgi:hypothetical protein